MALEREIWINSIIGNLYADNSFAARSVDHSMWVDGKKVHVPNAGVGSNVEKNRTILPATVKTRVDIDLDYEIAEFTTDPIRIPHAESVELSYPKRESVIMEDRAKLTENVHNSLLADWISGSASIAPGSDVKATIKAIKKRMDKDDVLQDGRYLLLDADEYNDLLDILTDSATANFLAGADPVTGVVGKYYGFGIYTRSKLDGTQKGLAWNANAVSRALGSTVMYDNPGDATYYSDIMSFLVRAGGTVIRSDGKGVLTY
jgi:hypothetical protein